MKHGLNTDQAEGQKLIAADQCAEVGREQAHFDVVHFAAANSAR